MNNIKKNSLDLPFIYELLSFVSSRTVRGEDKQMRPCKCRNACPCQWMETSTRTLRQRKILGVSIRRTLREFSQFKDGRELALPTPADTAPIPIKKRRNRRDEPEISIFQCCILIIVIPRHVCVKQILYRTHINFKPGGVKGFPFFNFYWTFLT